MPPITFTLHIGGDDYRDVIGRAKQEARAEDKTALIADRLVSLTVTDNAGIDSDTLALTLDDRASHIKLPPIEAVLKLWLNNVYMGTYHVSELATDDKAGTLAIQATGAKLTGPIKAPREASYDALTLSDLAARIAERHGHPLSISKALADTPLGHVDQRGESDLALLTRLVKPLNARAEGIFIKGTIKGRAKVTEVKAHWQGPEMPQKQAVMAGEKGQSYAIKETYTTEAEALDAATAKLAELGRSERDIACTLPGDPNYKAERLLTLSQHRHGGDYIIQSATHTISPGQIYTTAISATTKRSKR